MTTVASPTMIASGSFSNNNKPKPVSVVTTAIARARASALAALEKRTPPRTPPLPPSAAVPSKNKAKRLSVVGAAIARARASTLAVLEKKTPPQTPPLLPSSVVSSDSCDSLDEEEAISPVSVGPAALAGNDAQSRRQSQQFFFPNQSKFESAVPHVTSARDIHLKDHPVEKGAYAEYEALYNADSLITKDGIHMVRLL